MYMGSSPCVYLLCYNKSLLHDNRKYTVMLLMYHIPSISIHPQIVSVPRPPHVSLFDLEMHTSRLYHGGSFSRGYYSRKYSICSFNTGNNIVLALINVQ